MNHSEWKYIRRHIVKTALTVIFIIASILLIILVLMQEGKEAGRNTDQSDNILYDRIFRNSSNPLLKIYLEKR